MRGKKFLSEILTWVLSVLIILLLSTVKAGVSSAASDSMRKVSHPIDLEESNEDIEADLNRPPDSEDMSEDDDETLTAPTSEKPLKEVILDQTGNITIHDQSSDAMAGNLEEKTPAVAANEKVMTRRMGTGIKRQRHWKIWKNRC